MIMRIVFCILLIYLIPMLLLRIFPTEKTIDKSSENIQNVVSREEIYQEEGEESIDLYIDRKITVLTDNGPQMMDLEQYIFYVVLGEMPAEFELEALKAQAVVARTYACRKMNNPKHENADICTDSTCCQAYISQEDYIRYGKSQQDLQKVKDAVVSTRGEVLMYQGQLVEATYFSCSGGRTEDALAVWGKDVPYLQSVSSPGEENSAYYSNSVSFSIQQFSEKLGVALSGDSGAWIGTIVYTEGGGVSTIVIGNRTFTGVEMRQKLGLRSTSFEISCSADKVNITTKGYGHRVGMSQYGADAMAVQGSGYQNILYHYYTGTTLSVLSG